MSIQIKLKNSVVQDSTPSASDLPEVGELAVNGNINSIGGFMRASDNTIVKIFGPGSVTTPTATTTVSGISELATNSETTTGTATNRVVTPAGLNAVTVAERTTSNTNYVAKAGSTMTGVLQLTAGSTSVPAINFGASNTGIYQASGANNVRIAVDGSDAISASTAGGVNFVPKATALTSLTLGSQSATDKPLFFADAASVESASLLLDNSSNEFRVRNNRFSGKIVFAPSSNVEKARIDNSGKLLVGTSTARTNFFNLASTHTPRFQIESTNDDNGRAALGLIYGKTNASGAYIVLAKHRSNTVGDNTVVQSGDETGIISFQGSDGSQFVDTARIESFVDGTPGADDMPGRLVFSTTADGAASPTERLRIDSSGKIGINESSPLAKFHVKVADSGASAYAHCAAVFEDSDHTFIDIMSGTTGSGGINFGDSGGSQRGVVEYDHNSDFMRLIVAGGEAMRIDSSARLLIGTTTEGHVNADNLTVAGSGDTGMTIRSGTSDAGSIFFSDATSGNAEFAGFIQYLHNNNSLNIGTDETTRMIINNSGAVGIGTTSPSRKLDVVGDAEFIHDNGITIEASSTSTAGQLTIIGVNASDQVSAITRIKSISTGSSTAATVTAFENRNSSNAMNEHMRIDSSGRLFLGLTTLQYPKKLNIQGESGSIIHLNNYNTTTYAANTSTAIEFNVNTGNTGNQTGACELRAFKENGTNGDNARALSFYTGVNGGSPTERMRINSSGNVGIGATTIANDSGHAKLAISGTSGNNAGILVFQDSSNNEDGAIFSDNASLFIVADRDNTTASSNIVFRVDGSSEKMRIDSSGRLLIGHSTGNGFQTLSVSGNTGGSSGAGMLFLRRGLDRATIGTNVGADLGEVDFGDLDGNVYASIQGKTDAATGSNDFPGRIILATTADGGSSPSERMRIDSSGRVGIGDTSPDAPLVVRGTASVPHTVFKVNSNSESTKFSVQTVQDSDIRIGTQSNHPLALYTNQLERMRIDTSGNVAVGTTDMTGRIHARVNAASSTNFANDNAAVASGGQFIHISNSNTGGNEQAGFVMNASGSASAIGAIYMHKTNSYLGAMVFRMRTNANTSASRMEIDSQGNIGAPNGTNIYNASDVRLKKNVVDLDKGLSAIKSLRPVSFNWIDGFCDKEKDTLYGFIAQEVETVDRNLIQEFGNGSVTVEGQTINDALRVNEKFIIPMLVKAVQELEAKVAALEAA